MHLGIAFLTASALLVGASALAATDPPEVDAPGVPTALPGGPELPETLRRQLADALAQQPSDYVPRTHHRRADGSPIYSNRLLLEASPYLQQHAHNPVNWYPWGDEAFDTAKRLGRPVLVSIGYSTCHWCHVMEEESFDNLETARYLNQHYVAIKVDREARPDVDAIYMAAVHAMRGRGGWPLNVWVTPDRRPFYGGTYFPPQAAGSRPSFGDVLRGIVEEYAKDPGRVDQISRQLTAAIRSNLEGRVPVSSQFPDATVFDTAWAQTSSTADRSWGGRSGSPKFPSTLPVRFLLRHYLRSGEREALDLASLTLEKMAAGGIHDQVGGGFHRYATDSRWLVPHFEKMLYDNALLAISYLEAGQLTGRSDLVDVARRILDYLEREMTSPEGVFYSATDADSLNDEGEREEGWFFTWTPAELGEALKPELAPVVTRYYGVTDAGNHEGRNILHTWSPADQVAAEFEITVDDLQTALATARPRLYQTRSLRSPPLRDDKVLVAWNGLAISAFARAGLLLNEARYVAIASRAAEFILTSMRKEGRLHRVYQRGRAEGPAFLEDYAFLIAGILDLYESNTRLHWLGEAIALQAVLDRHYRDTAAGGYYKTADDHEELLAREKPSSDGAIPSGNSVAVLNLLRLTEFTGERRYEETAVQAFSGFHDALERSPTALAEMLLALDFYLAERVEIVLLHPPDENGLEAMLKPTRATFLPSRVIAVARDDASLAKHAEVNTLLKGRSARKGRTTAYLCQDRVCGFPTEDPEAFAKQLSKLRAPPRPSPRSAELQGGGTP